MRGTKVVNGSGVCEVIAVGDQTENGKVFSAAQIDDIVQTPLNEQLDRLAQVISRLGYGIAILVLVGRVVAYFISPSATPFDWSPLPPTSCRAS